MRTRNIPSGRWRQTLDELSRAYAGAFVSVEILNSEVGAQPQVVDEPLRGITADRSGVMISFAGLDHRLTHPRDVRIVETDEGAVVAVEIEESSGTNTLLRFRSPARPEIFDPAVE